MRAPGRRHTPHPQQATGSVRGPWPSGSQRGSLQQQYPLASLPGKFQCVLILTHPSSSPQVSDGLGSGVRDRSEATGPGWSAILRETLSGLCHLCRFPGTVQM